MATIDELNEKLELVLRGVKIGMKDTLNVTEVAFMFGKSERTIRRWVSEKIIPYHVTENGHLRFSKSEIDKYMLGRTRIATADELELNAAKYCITK